MERPAPGPDHARHRAAAIAAASILAVGWGMMAHEWGHVVAGWLAGGRPTLLTTTEVLGDFTALPPAGFVAFGAAGSIVNALLCGLGAWGLARRRASADLRLVAWFFFAVNGMLVTTKMMVEGALGWGDWMTILRPLPDTTVARIVVFLAGTLGVRFLVRRSGVALASLVPAGDPARRRAEARRVLVLGALAATALVVGGGVASPIGMARAIPLSLGAGLGPFIPLAFSLRFVPGSSRHLEGPPATGSGPWMLLAGVTTAILWFLAGPGIRLSAAAAR